MCFTSKVMYFLSNDGFSTINIILFSHVVISSLQNNNYANVFVRQDCHHWTMSMVLKQALWTATVVAATSYYHQQSNNSEKKPRRIKQNNGRHSTDQDNFAGSPQPVRFTKSKSPSKTKQPSPVGKKNSSSSISKSPSKTKQPSPFGKKVVRPL